MENCIWICSSLFVDMELWQTVLRNGVKKFTDENTKGKIYDIKLSFNYLSGTNIRLAYKVKHSQADDLAKDLDKYFKHYFHTIAPAKIFATPGDGLFMAIPPYTIKYGLYELPSLTGSENTDPETTLSYSIIDALSETEVDADALLTLGFYLHVALINEYLQLFSSQGLNSILNGIPVPADADYSEPEFQETYLECELLLKEIFHQLRYTSEDPPPDWILNWSAVSRTALEQEDPAGSKKLIRDLRNAIDNQLGFDRKLKDLLNYFIKQMY